MTVANSHLERALRVSLAAHAEEAGYGMTDEPWVSGFTGWRFGQSASPTLIAALDTPAHPMPDNLASVWAEYRGWRDLSRGHVEPHIGARMAGLEHLMDTMPDASAAGIGARLAWLSHLANLDHYRTNAEDTALAARLAADFHEFAKAAQYGRPGEPAPAVPDRRTQAGRRAEVLSILHRSPELADREIGRQVGVSPQTVSNLRKKLSANCPP